MKTGNTQIASPLLHRLMDHDPGSTVAHDEARYMDYPTLRLDIRRHLEQILNTRLNLMSDFSVESECARSILNYGIVDVSNQYYNFKKNQKVLCKTIEHTLSHFEPRLQHIRVELLDNDDALNRQFRFRISGVVNLKPDPVQTAFESDLDIMHYQFTLDEEA